MINEKGQDYELQVFGGYFVPKILPFRVSQPPFRKFSKYNRDGHWNEKQRLKYTVFLEFFQKLLEDEEGIRNARIYEMMADMIITRNPSQCRSHHQKMEQHRKNITDIVTSVREKYQPSVYQQKKERYSVLIKTLLENSDKYVRLPANKSKKDGKLKQSLVIQEAGDIGKDQEENVQKQNGNLPVEEEEVECLYKKDKEDNKRTGDYSDEQQEQQEASKAKPHVFGNQHWIFDQDCGNPFKNGKDQKYQNKKVGPIGFRSTQSFFADHKYTFPKGQFREVSSNSDPQIKSQRKESSQRVLQQCRELDHSYRLISPEPVRRQSASMMEMPQVLIQKGSQQRQAKDQNNNMGPQNPFRSIPSPFGSFGPLQNYMYIAPNSSNSLSSPFPYSADEIVHLTYQIHQLEDQRKRRQDNMNRLWSECHVEMVMENQLREHIQRLRQIVSKFQRN